MNSLARSLAVLDLFTDTAPVWAADGLIEQIGVTRPTGYRYVRELVGAGLLSRIGAGLYSLGPRIIELDYLMRRTDPMLAASRTVIRDLVADTGCTVMLAGLYGDHIVTTHQEAGIESLALTYGRGTTFPVAMGAGSKIIIAQFARARLARLHTADTRAFARAKLGHNLESVRTTLAAIRKAGYAISHGELDPGYVGIAAPVFNRDRDVLGSVIAALSDKRLKIVALDRLAARVRDAGERISTGMAI